MDLKILPTKRQATEDLHSTLDIVYGTPLFTTSFSQICEGKWRKDHRDTWHDVILKIVSPNNKDTLAECIRNEVNTLTTLQELTVKEKEDAPFFFMKMVEVLYLDDKTVLVLERGVQDLFEYYKNRSTIDLARSLHVIECARDMTLALIKLHALGFTHNDIKPENYILRKTDSTGVALIDFGFACQPDHLGMDSFLRNSRFGTEIYMHPEMFSSYSPTLYEGDLFGLGMCIFVLMACTLPFASKTSIPNKARIRNAFAEGSDWTKLVFIPKNLKGLPMYANWYDIVSKLCSGRWYKAEEDILKHPFFVHKI